MKRLTLLLFVLVVGTALSASAATYGFNCITGNNLTDCANGVAQLRVDVSDAGSGKVDFKFYHVGVVPMSITDVHFDDGTLLGIASITESAGVDFEQGASPKDLPGGGGISPKFETTKDFSADSESPTQPNGVNPGPPTEWLTITFNLLSGKTYADTLAALAGGADLRIGIHVQGFDGGGSESFVNKKIRLDEIPEPGFYGALALGLSGLFMAYRKRQSN